VHAKKTRDRKKELLEISEGLIIKMEKESFLLREYLGIFIDTNMLLLSIYPEEFSYYYLTKLMCIYTHS
jgi:hypothetical protein